jgi:hypothetical protein
MDRESGREREREREVRNVSHKFAIASNIKFTGTPRSLQREYKEHEEKFINKFAGEGGGEGTCHVRPAVEDEKRREGERDRRRESEKEQRMLRAFRPNRSSLSSFW